MRVDPGLDVDEELAAAAFDHVAQQGEGRAAEAEEGHPAPQFVPRERDGGVDVGELGRDDVNGPGEELSVLRVAGGGRFQGVGEVGALFVDHFDGHAHCLRDDEDV